MSAPDAVPWLSGEDAEAEARALFDDVYLLGKQEGQAERIDRWALAMLSLGALIGSIVVGGLLSVYLAVFATVDRCAAVVWSMGVGR